MSRHSSRIRSAARPALHSDYVSPSVPKLVIYHDGVVVKQALEEQAGSLCMVPVGEIKVYDPPLHRRGQPTLVRSWLSHQNSIIAGKKASIDLASGDRLRGRIITVEPLMIEGSATNGEHNKTWVTTIKDYSAITVDTEGSGILVHHEGKEGSYAEFLSSECSWKSRYSLRVIDANYHLDHYAIINAEMIEKRKFNVSLAKAYLGLSQPYIRASSVSRSMATASESTDRGSSEAISQSLVGDHEMLEEITLHGQDTIPLHSEQGKVAYQYYHDINSNHTYAKIKLRTAMSVYGKVEASLVDENRDITISMGKISPKRERNLTLDNLPVEQIECESKATTSLIKKTNGIRSYSVGISITARQVTRIDDRITITVRYQLPYRALVRDNQCPTKIEDQIMEWDLHVPATQEAVTSCSFIYDVED